MARTARILAVVLPLLLAGCLPPFVTESRARAEVTRMPLAAPNPTAGEFHAAVDETQAAIRRAHPYAESLEELDPDWRMSREILSAPGCEHDLMLGFGRHPWRKSAVYRVDGQPASLSVDFHVHLVPVGPDRTRVEVFTIRPEVSVEQVYGLIELPHTYEVPARTAVDIPVEPSTVEEYEILLAIGRELGEEGMPPIVRPAESG